MMPPGVVSEKMEPEQLFDATNILLYLQVQGLTFPSIIITACSENFKLSRKDEFNNFTIILTFLSHVDLDILKIRVQYMKFLTVMSIIGLYLYVCLFCI